MIDPEIIIEIGNEDQKKLVCAEIKCFIIIVEEYFIKTNLSCGWFEKAIIPLNFEQKVRELTDDENYKAFRGRVLVCAKSLLDREDKILLINPELFSTFSDTQVRYHMYLHETNHYISKQKKSDYSNLSTSNKYYMENIALLYEEYCSERFAFSINDILADGLYKERSQIFLDFHRNIMQRHYEIVCDIRETLLGVERAINDFKAHHNGDVFMQTVIPLLSPHLLSFFYLMAFQVAAPEILNKSILDFPHPFNHVAAIQLKELCHKSFPEQLEAENAIQIVRDFFYLFGFELFDPALGVKNVLGVRVF